MVRQAVRVPVWRWENGEQVAQALHLLISRELDGTQIKCSLCYYPPGTPALGVAQALYRQMQRYGIERVFQQAKQQLGLHQNQTRSWPAWQHHVALTMMALHLLLDTQSGHAVARTRNHSPPLLCQPQTCLGSEIAKPVAPGRGPARRCPPASEGQCP